MKFVPVLLLLSVSTALRAQQLSGVVLDKSTKQPVAYATLSAGNSIVSTTADGRFNLTKLSPGDTIMVTNIGYKTTKIGYNISSPKEITIYLQQTTILLRSVSVKSQHDPKADSLRVRKQFASVFEYKKPTYKDMFITIDPYKYKYNDYIFATNSTASIVSVNLLSVISLLSPNKDQTSKLQKKLLKDEETDYIDRVFSKQKITGITNLKGDTLLNFMDDYRPTIKQAKSMTDYEMMLYIKKSYAEFIRSYNNKERSPFTK